MPTSPSIREYRTRLIADVVTGKLDVREAAFPLTEQADEYAEIAEEIEDEAEGTDEQEEADE